MCLTKEQIEDYKSKLHNERAKLVKALQAPAIKGMWKQVVDKYSDQAHFLYEILQNADDAEATKARLILHDTELVFVHNGKRSFSISDVETEADDGPKGTLGDINAITSVGQSNKNDAAKIGKFGMGFKSVFQYTSSPIIYDNNFRFKITDYMVPNWLDSDYADRKPDETVFVFPFDRKDISPPQAKKEIFEKLKKLVLPVLFLHSMEKIEYECDGERGEYSKKCLESEIYDSTIATKYEIVNDSENDKSFLWLFSRETTDKYIYSVGYFVDEMGKLIPQINYPAFCFFPTKVVTHLSFLIHAPFLLTDSREGIKANCDHNIEMINLLAKLAADALDFFVKKGEKEQCRIIGDDITKIIPLQKTLFNVVDTDEISFRPFYFEIQNKLKNGLLPTKDGYVSADKACWADTLSMTQVFDDIEVYDRTWVFLSKAGRRNNAELAEYLGEMGVRYITLETLIKDLTREFIECQSIDWLCSLYKIVLENQNAVKSANVAPIFLNAEHKACPAYENNEPNLYLSSPNSDGYNVVLAELENNAVAKELLNKLNISKPVLRDKIYQKILTKDEFNEIDDFKDILDYYIECANQGDQYSKSKLINDLNKKAFLAVVDVDGMEQPVASPNSGVYLMNDELKRYFSNYKEALFIDENKYNAILSEEAKRTFHEFLRDLGLSETALNMQSDSDSGSFYKAAGYSVHWTRYARYYRYFLAGAEEFLHVLINDRNVSDSKILLHQMVLGLRHSNYAYEKDRLFGYRCEYFYRDHLKAFATNYPVANLFRTEKWLIDNAGEWVSPRETFLQRLSNNYNISDSDVRKFMIEYLGIQEEHPEYNTLSDDIRKKVELSDLLAENGINDLSTEEIALIKEMREKKSGETTPAEGNKSGSGNGKTSSSTTNKTLNNDLDEEDDGQDDSPEKRITKEIAKLAEKKKRGDSDPSDDYSDENDIDEDEYTKASIDFTKKIQKIKDRCAVEVYDLKQYQEAQKQAIEAERYSYQWFSALLKMEILSSNENNANSREVSISFAKVKKDPDSKKTLILEQPNKNIPSVIEELYGVNLNLRMKDGSDKSLPFEAASIRSYSLRVMLMHPDQLVDLDLSQVTSASIIAKSPVFLLQELQKQFDALSFAPDYDMKASLCKNIRFVFGPPGTGKTTFLAKNVLKKLVDENENIKVLVLAPTNKAADVIVSRTIDIMSSDDGYKNWLARFGVTNDETIEENGIFCSKNYDIEKHNQNVVVTTIARYPYDGMKSEGKEDRLLRDVNWDYVVIDEASMIPLVQLIYVLYSQKPKQFIIAGDPFQIEPTTAVDMWKDENIYKMVKLDSFTNIRTEPHKFEVELLKTQYRSVPSVGEIFSALTYESSLTHYRKEESRRALNIDEFLSYSSLNLVKFPVHKYESIYRSKKLNKSNYQIYSALFAYEFTFYLAKKIAEKNPSEHFKIGVISPYAAQAKLINNLLIAEKIPDSVSVLCGTIHGFQGDECDVLVTVFNAPESMSSNDNMFLNRKNIINVAISRAKDYLFVLMPDDKTVKVENLKLVKKVEALMKNNSLCTEIGSHELEKKMFGNETYLEENTFSTGHQSVNVYGTPEKKYEVRSEENAIDIQVHKEIV